MHGGGKFAQILKLGSTSRRCSPDQMLWQSMCCAGIADTPAGAVLNISLGRCKFPVAIIDCYYAHRLLASTFLDRLQAMTRGMCDDVEVVLIGSNDDVEPLHPALEGLIWHDSVVIGPVEEPSQSSRCTQLCQRADAT